MTTAYARTEIANYFDLPEAEQRRHFDEHEQGVFEMSFVMNPRTKDMPEEDREYLPLNRFERADGSKLWSGTYGQSYFDAFFLKIGRDGQTVTIGHRYF